MAIRNVVDLLYPENNVNALAEVLKGGGYKPEDVIVMTVTAGEKDGSLKPLAANITAKLNALLAGLKKDDLVMVALAGHGIQPAGDKAYFCGYQAKLGDPTTMIAVDSVIEAMNRSPASTKILLVDACRDSPGSRTLKPRETAPVDLPSMTGSRDGTTTIAYFSCDKGEKSWEVDELKHGLFFDLIIKGLAGAADDYPDGLITWGEMREYVERNLNFYTAKYSGRKQTPHLRGEARNAAPIVVRPISGAVDLSRAGPAGPETGDAVNEDFRAIASSSLPRGWDGPAFTRTYDEKASRPCVELRRKEGLHGLTIPLAKPLAGDFAVEIEFLMRMDRDVWKEFQYHAIGLWLEGEDGQVFPVTIDSAGQVTFANTATRSTGKFKPNEINRLRLVRTGDSCRLDLNDGDAASDKIFTGQINGLQLYVNHWWGREVGSGPNYTTRIYSVKAGSTTPGDPARVGRVPLNENMHAHEQGAVLPPGWVGEGFSVATDERYELRALEVNKAAGEVFWVIVPKMDATIGHGRPFFLDLDVRLCGYDNPNRDYDPGIPPGQEVYVRLEGPDSLPLTIALDPYGRVRIGSEKEVQAKWFARQQTNRLRLVHLNRDGRSAVQVLVNGVQVTETNQPFFGNYAGFAIGLVGGTPTRDIAWGFPAKLYSVKLTALPGTDAATTQFKGVMEDFAMVPVGRGPVGWGVANLGCRRRWGRPGNLLSSLGLELIDNAKPGMAVIPNLSLNGNFAAGIEFSHFERLHKDKIFLRFIGGGKTPMLVVALFFQEDKFWVQAQIGAITSQAVNVSTILDAKKSNILALKRVGAAIGIMLNDQPIVTIPAGKTLATYESFQIELSTATDSSPRLTRVMLFPE